MCCAVEHRLYLLQLRYGHDMRPGSQSLHDCNYLRKLDKFTASLRPAPSSYSFLTGANALLKLRSSGPKHRGLPVSHSYTCTYPVAHSARSFSMLQSHATIGQLKASLFLRTVLSAGFSICRQPMVLPDSLPAINPSNIHSSRGSCYGQQKS